METTAPVSVGCGIGRTVRTALLLTATAPELETLTEYFPDWLGLAFVRIKEEAVAPGILDSINRPLIGQRLAADGPDREGRQASVRNRDAGGLAQYAGRNGAHAASINGRKINGRNLAGRKRGIINRGFVNQAHKGTAHLLIIRCAAQFSADTDGVVARKNTSWHRGGSLERTVEINLQVCSIISGRQVRPGIKRTNAGCVNCGDIYAIGGGLEATESG